MKVGQFVKVKVNARGKTEIGRITGVYGDDISVETKSGFEVKASLSSVQPALLLILDLNGVLVHRAGRKFITLRPGLTDFLTYIFKNFVVGVWSSCEKRNGEEIITAAFGDEFRSELSFLMFRDECTPAPTETNSYATVKDLANLWVKFHGVFDQYNTIILDDSPEKCSHLRNALCPLPFEPTNNEDTELARIENVLKSIVEGGNFFEILDAEQSAFHGFMEAFAQQKSNPQAELEGSQTPPAKQQSASHSHRASKRQSPIAVDETPAANPTNNTSNGGSPSEAAPASSGIPKPRSKQHQQQATSSSSSPQTATSAGLQKLMKLGPVGEITSGATEEETLFLKQGKNAMPYLAEQKQPYQQQTPSSSQGGSGMLPVGAVGIDSIEGSSYPQEEAATGSHSKNGHHHHHHHHQGGRGRGGRGGRGYYRGGRGGNGGNN